MTKYVRDVTLIIALDPEAIFVFQLDNNRPRKQYVFAGCDGKYAQIFESEKHMKAGKNPAFISCSTVVLEVTQ